MYSEKLMNYLYSYDMPHKQKKRRIQIIKNPPTKAEL